MNWAHSGPISIQTLFKTMDKVKKYILDNFEGLFVLTILITISLINFFIYSKIAFLNFYYLPIMIAGYYLGKRMAVLGAFFTILMVWVFVLADLENYYTQVGSFDLYFNLTVWSGFLILAGWVIGSLRDELQITDKLRAELEVLVQKRTTKLRSLASLPDESLDPIYRVDDNYTLLYSNSAGLSFLQHWACKVGKKIPPPFIQTIAEIESPAERNSMEIDLEDRIFEFNVVKVPEMNYCNIYGQDITDRKKAENNVIAAKMAAEKANSSKSRFLSTMSHELRTPLNAILGFSDLLKGQHFGELNPKQEGHVAHILSSGKHLLDLINELLDIAKIDSGTMSLELTKISPQEAIPEVVILIAGQCKDKNLEVTTHIDPALNTMTGDLQKFKQIMLNLLSNAVKYTPEKGRIDIRAEKDGHLARISVTDTGIGIKKEDQKKVFDEFVQVDRARDENLGGTGIGLALTRRLVEMHGGDIGVDSEPGKGSTFWFVLPLKPFPKGEVVEPVAQPAGSSRVAERRILVVEDNEVNISMILDALSIGGHQVIVARNGQEAIDLAVSEKPELIFMDMRMPVMDGLEATQRLRALPEFANTPIIALTATVGENSKQKTLDAGCTDYLSKPVQISELLEILDRYL